jgi:hypothetical protein
VNLTILGPNLRSHATFHIHKAGCADLKKMEYRGAQKYNEEWGDLHSIAAEYWQDQINENEAGSVWATPEGYYGEFTIFPCAKALPEKLS